MKIWFSFFERTYHGSEPFFSDPREIPNANLLTENFSEIKEEVMNFIHSKKVLNNYFNKSTVEYGTNWKTVALRSWNKKYKLVEKQLPKLTSIINQIPNCVSCSFSLLEPKSHIKAHFGDTNAIWRCHLPLIVPAQLPIAGLRVGTEKRSWEEGVLLPFCDAHQHESWNQSDQDRYIIIIDIIKPEFKSKTQHICTTVLSSLALQKIAEKFNVLYKLPLFFQIVSFCFAYLIIRTKNKLKYSIFY